MMDADILFVGISPYNSIQSQILNPNPFKMNKPLFTKLLSCYEFFIEMYCLIAFNKIISDKIIYWMLDVSPTASYGSCSSVHLSITKFSQDWIISFFLILHIKMIMTFSGWQIGGPNLGQMGQNQESKVWLISFSWNCM